LLLVAGVEDLPKAFMAVVVVGLAAIVLLLLGNHQAVVAAQSLL
jgi:hypothetical protein